MQKVYLLCLTSFVLCRTALDHRCLGMLPGIQPSEFACLVNEEKRYFPQGGAAALPGMPTREQVELELRESEKMKHTFLRNMCGVVGAKLELHRG